MGKNKKTEKQVINCPCGYPLPYKSCCGRFHSGVIYPESAEALMRSRYTAYVLEDVQYLLQTWLEGDCPRPLTLTRTNWIGLNVIATEAGRSGDNEGWVEFEARYKVNGKAERMRERSYFVRQQGKWVYASAC